MPLQFPSPGQDSASPLVSPVAVPLDGSFASDASGAEGVGFGSSDSSASPVEVSPFLRPMLRLSQGGLVEFRALK